MLSIKFTKAKTQEKNRCEKRGEQIIQASERHFNATGNDKKDPNKECGYGKITKLLEKRMFFKNIRERLSNNKEIIELLFTAAIVSATWASVYVTNGQWSAATKQLDVMKEQSRPWIRVDITFARPIMFTQWAGQKHVNMSFKFDIKNFGQIPAINIRIFTHVQQNPTGDRKFVLDADQSGVCRSAMETADRDKSGGVAAFPQEPKIVENGGGTGGLYKTDDRIIFIINGCVDYTYGDGLHGQTGFRKMLGKVNGNIVEGIGFPDVAPTPNWLPPSPELLASGFPPDHPLVGYVDTSDLWLHDDDNGNYAK